MNDKRTIYLVFRRSDDIEIHAAFTTRELAETFRTKLYERAYQDEWDTTVGNTIPDVSKMKSPEEITIDEIDRYFGQFDHKCWIETRTLKGPINA